jgi:hypothetical protein
MPPIDRYGPGDVPADWNIKVERMRRIFATLFVLTIPSLLAAGCEESKSATPLSPSIAGPIAGVVITEPGVVSPNGDARIASDKQPITLTVDNASSNGVRPLSYRFEVATQADFSNPAFTQNGIKPGDGQTSFLLPQSLDPGRAEQVYYWRAKAYDGANDGDFTPPVKFTVFRPVTIGRSNAISPPDNSTTTTTKPVLEIQNAPVTGPAAEIHVLFEVATDGAMANRIISAEVPAGGSGRTAYGIQNDLLPSTRYFWRARTFDLAGHTGDYSNVFSFMTPAAPSTGGGGGGGGGGTPISSPNDQIDMKSVVIEYGADIRSWVVDSTITSVTRNGTTFCTNHTKAGQWPVLPFFGDPSVSIEGNQWFFANIGGVWYGGANEWMRPGQTCKDVGGNIGADNFGSAPHLSHWTPHSGEVIGVDVSTPARAGQQGTAERSNIVLFTWP